MRRPSDRAIRATCERLAGRAAAPTLVPMVRAILTELDRADERVPSVRDEVEALARYIARARREIRAIGADAIAQAYIPTASDELGAIAQHLEDATGTILEACEEIENSLDPGAASAADTRQAIRAQVTRIFEACNFQDLTGQRIAKIVETLREIEVRTQALLAITRGRRASTASGGRARPPAPARTGDAALLNGPALRGEGVSQSDIDAMLNG